MPYSRGFGIQEICMYKVFPQVLQEGLLELYDISFLFFLSIFFCLQLCIIRVYRISFPNTDHRIHPILLLDIDRYHREIYCIHKEEKKNNPFPNLCFWYSCGRVTWGKELLLTNKIILCYSILFYFILEVVHYACQWSSVSVMMQYVVLVVDIRIHRQFLVWILHYLVTRPCILSRHIQGTYTSTNVQNNVSKILIVYVRTQWHGFQIYQLRVQLRLDLGSARSF